MKPSHQRRSPPTRQIALLFEPPILRDLDPSERANAIACLTKLLIEATEPASKENSDEEC
jgi:hypothetical protein